METSTALGFLTVGYVRRALFMYHRISDKLHAVYADM